MAAYLTSKPARMFAAAPLITLIVGCATNDVRHPRPPTWMYEKVTGSHIPRYRGGARPGIRTTTPSDLGSLPGVIVLQSN